MKKKSLEKTFIEELAKTANISVACERVGLSRQTVYRWMENEKRFSKNVDEAKKLGVESINDLAESKLITDIKIGKPRAYRYWLDNHKKEYMRPRPKNFWEDMGKEKIDAIEVKIYSRKEDVERDEEIEKNGGNSLEGWVEEKPSESDNR